MGQNGAGKVGGQVDSHVWSWRRRIGLRTRYAFPNHNTLDNPCLPEIVWRRTRQFFIIFTMEHPRFGTEPDTAVVTVGCSAPHSFRNAKWSTETLLRGSAECLTLLLGSRVLLLSCLHLPPRTFFQRPTPTTALRLLISSSSTPPSTSNSAASGESLEPFHPLPSELAPLWVPAAVAPADIQFMRGHLDLEWAETFRAVRNHIYRLSRCSRCCCFRCETSPGLNAQVNTSIYVVEGGGRQRRGAAAVG
ncbi:hypothetical protein B0T26DRAFT_488609 [Lasiosphaeria miniovina]|uniref:Uncharacterized protein n=1 Tax=Lasiosphaeria miniovina TaxID=1954250 RepID=A0AA39ZSW5_9PEZI|nr:uncharacterized protein B0T26DRAFT_488609 [Lasiosphaeria miniovina]KAK0703030.1 hypothetical protein B0T26DRAFT_488609 [Lasiosphaeria miniovina]